MEINVQVRPGEVWELKVNGQLIFEGVGEGGSDRDDLQDRLKDWRGELRRKSLCAGVVNRARTIINREDHIENTPDKKRAAYARGLIAGLLNETVPHPMPGVPPMCVETTRCYMEGFEWGESLRNASQ